MRNNRECSLKSQLIHTLMCSLGIDRNGADALIGNYPHILELNVDTLNEILHRLQFKYLFSRSDVKKLLIYRTELFETPALIMEKDSLFKRLYNIGDVEFGTMLKTNFNIIDIPNDDLIKFITEVEKTCEVSHEFTRKLFSQNANLLSQNIEDSIDNLKTKINLLNLYGIPTSEIEQHPDICANQLDNINTKLKFAYLTKTPLQTYLSEKYYRHQKEKIYARFMGQMQRLYRVNIYALEPTFCRQSKYTTEQLMKFYPWNDSAINYINELFTRHYTLLSTEVDSFFATLHAQKTCNELES